MNKRLVTKGFAAIAALALVHAASAADMKAAVVSGGKLVLQTKPIPEPTAKDVRIKVRAAGVNPADYGFFANRNDAVPGFDTAGVVDAVGADVKEFKKGDEVIAMAPSGSYAQFVIAPTNRVAKKPKKLSFEEAAGIPVVGETSYRALVEVAKLQKGQRVLIHGGAGGVGSASVQIAKALGAYVIATASPRNHEFLKSIGADEVIDYNVVRFEDKLKDIDIALNTVDEDTGTRSLKIVKPNGYIVSVTNGPSADKCAAAKVHCARPDRNVGPSVAELLTKVGELADGGKYKVHVDGKFPLADATQAWDKAKEKHTRGKLVIVIPQ